MHLHPLLHPKDGSASVFEQLFGRLADAAAPADRVLADAHREMSTLLDDVARCCTDWYDSPTDETGTVVQADLQRIAEMRARRHARSHGRTNPCGWSSSAVRRPKWNNNVRFGGAAPL